MAFEKAKAYLDSYGLTDRIIETEHSSATVAEAAEAIGCEEAMICKTLSFLQDEKPVLILADMVGPLVGHEIGGVCPFGANEGVTVYLDESLRKHEIVYPAVGNDHSGVKLTIPELEKCSGYTEWVDVCKQPE